MCVAIMCSKSPPYSPHSSAYTFHMLMNGISSFYTYVCFIWRDEWLSALLVIVVLLVLVIVALGMVSGIIRYFLGFFQRAHPAFVGHCHNTYGKESRI